MRNVSAEELTAFENFTIDLMRNTLARGLAVTVFHRDGRVLYERYLGCRDAQTAAKIDEDTYFGIASVTKSFTSLAILQLAEQGIEFEGCYRATTLNKLGHVDGLVNRTRSRSRNVKHMPLATGNGKPGTSVFALDKMDLEFLDVGNIHVFLPVSVCRALRLRPPHGRNFVFAKYGCAEVGVRLHHARTHVSRVSELRKCTIGTRWCACGTYDGQPAAASSQPSSSTPKRSRALAMPPSSTARVT